jgi:MFS family permease
MSTAALGTADPSATSAMATTTRIHPRALLRACGGPRYAVALAVDALGTGLLRPLLLLYGVTVLRLSAPVTGTAMTAGVVAGLVCMPAVGRWLDRGARGTVVAASMLVRVLGVALLLATPTGNGVRTATQNCSCGCGQPVAERRKFVNQEHYSTWLSQLRYFGRNRRARP